MAEHSYLSEREEAIREVLRDVAKNGRPAYVDPKNYIAVIDRLEEALKENEKLKKEIRQKALDEMARLTQEIEEPSEVNRLWQENKELRQRIDELEKG